MSKQVSFKVEVTDTFGGEANYSWVKRETLTVPEGTSDLAIVRRAKALMGWNGTRCRTDNYGDSFTLTPFGLCQVMFINFDYS